MPWKAAYPKEIRNQMIELVQAGMSPEELSRKHEPSSEAIRGWVKKAKRDADTQPSTFLEGEVDDAVESCVSEGNSQPDDRAGERECRRRS